MSLTTSWNSATPLRPWGALAVFAGLWLACYVGVFMPGAVLGPVKLDLGLTDEQLGRLNTAYILAFILATPLAGFIGDRKPRKPLLLAAIWLQCLAAIGSGTATSFTSLAAWRAVAGVGEGVFTGLSPSWLADLFPPRQRGIVFAILYTTGQFAAWIAYAGGASIAAGHGWHRAFTLSAIAPGLLSLLLLWLQEPAREADPSGKDPASPAHASLSDIRKLLTDGNFLMYINAYLFRMVAIGGLFYWTAQYLSRYWPITNAAAVKFVGISYVITGIPAILLGGYLGGRLSTRLHGSWLCFLIGGDALAGVATLALLLLPLDIASAQAAFLAEVLFAGFAWGAITPVIFDISPARLRNSAMSIALAASNIGSAFVGSELIGTISDHSNLRTGLLVIPAAYAVSVTLWAWLLFRRPARQPTAHPLSSPLQEGAPA